MKVVFSFQKNNSLKPQKQNAVFGAGLTPKIAQEIQQVDDLAISNRLAKKGIPTEFKGNKVVAWCCDKTVEIFEQLNEKYHTRLALPKGIYVDDFEKLNVDDVNATGFCNLFPTDKFKKNSNEFVPGDVIFFNSFETFKNQFPIEWQVLHNWNKINTIADAQYVTKYSSTNHFLDVFIHEFSHSTHEERLRKKIGGEVLEVKIDSVKTAKNIEEYKQKYGEKISQICKYALTNPLEAVACDMSRIITSCLDGNTLMPRKNPFIGTPYERLSLWKRVNIPYYVDEQRPLIEILRNFWNGNFD